MSRILVVDDKEENLYYLQALLSAHGHEVQVARNGAEGLAEARQSAPDLVVADLLMPVMDGYTLLRHWKSDPQLRGIKFIVYTATYTDAEDERLALRMGADAFILKPAEPEQFLARIAQVQSLAGDRLAESPGAPDRDEWALMQSYSRALIRKLEERTVQLQETNRALQGDLEARRKVEAQLRLLNAAVLQSSESVLITDAMLDEPGPRIVFANPAFTRLTGYASEEVIGKSPRFLQGPRTDREVLRRLRADLERGATFSGEAVNYRKDGSEYDQEWQVAPILDGQGVATHFVALQRDVTGRNRAARSLLDSSLEQRRLREQLELEHRRLVAAQRVAGVGSWETDLASGDVIWSEETHRIHETQPGSFQSSHAAFLEIVHPDDRARVDEAFARSVAGAGAGVVEHRLLMADGRIKHVEERWELEFDADRRPVRALGTCQDITARTQGETALRQTSDRLLLATQSARIGIWDWDIPANRLIWDAQMLQQYGLREGEFGEVYEAWIRHVHPEDRQRVLDETTAALEGPGHYRTTFRIVRPDGQVHHIEANGLVQRAADGTVLRMIGANRDISEQVQAEQRIRYLNRVYAMTSSINSLIVRAGDRDELLRQACRIAVDSGGFHFAMIGTVVPGGLQFVAMAAADPTVIDDVGPYMAERGLTPSPMAARALAEKRPCVSNDSQADPQVTAVEMHRRHGIHSMAMLPLLVADQPAGVLALYAVETEFFHDEEMALLIELAGDVALAIDHIEARNRLEYLAYYDALTGLANRSLFLERVGQYVRGSRGAGQTLAVLIFDLERFKNINDSLGRAAGDQLLRQVGAWLAQHFGDANRIARIDADHFALVLPDDGHVSGIAYSIERMMAAFTKHPFEVSGESLRIAARVGIAMWPADGDDAETLFKCAEAALKKANSSGERYLFHAQQMTHAVADKLALESQLRTALDNDEFVLHYQPKVDLGSGRLIGAEALIRWNNPRSGLMPPGLFIPVLEETGMINDVGRWALQQALADWMRWRGAGLAAVPVAVNVSPLQLRDPSFIRQLERAVAVAPDAARGLELEITESVIMADLQQGIARLRTIRDMGIGIAIDDFGTGFSSLGYLAKLPIDKLKIDRMFIEDMDASAEGMSLISTMLTLAHSLRLKVVAEGVETAEQARQLKRLACDQIQGYFVSKPLACAEFEARFLAVGWRLPNLD